MALPIIPFIAMAGRAIRHIRWDKIVAFSFMLGITGFTVSAFLNEVVDSALRLWPFIGLACLFFLAKEIIHAWRAIKVKEASTKINMNRE